MYMFAYGWSAEIQTSDTIDEDNMPITSHLFEAYLKCQTKCFLRSLNEPAAGNRFSNWVQAQQASYLSEGIKRLTQGAAQNECITRPITRQEVQSVKWRLAVETNARVQNLESTIHVVERLAFERRDNSPVFTPIRFIFTNKLHRDDRLLLAFDALVTITPVAVEKPYFPTVWQKTMR